MSTNKYEYPEECDNFEICEKYGHIFNTCLGEDGRKFYKGYQAVSTEPRCSPWQQKQFQLLHAIFTGKLPK